MKIKNVEFEKKVFDLKELPSGELEEIAVMGRSNVGKSSVINTLTGIKKLTYTSKTPGRTRALNFFLVNEEFYLVDLPGYGYAKVSKKMKSNWKKLMEGYLRERTNLVLCILLIDAKVGPTSLDLQMLDFLLFNERPVLVVATKFDKLKKSQQVKRVKEIKRKLEFEKDQLILPFSSKTGEGKEELLEIISDIIEGEE